MKMKHKWRLVDFINNREDHKCALLGATGMGAKYIAREVDMTPGMVYYRLKLASIKLSGVRDGSSPFTAVIVSAARTALDAKLMGYLAKHDAFTREQIQKVDWQQRKIA